MSTFHVAMPTPHYFTDSGRAGRLKQIEQVRTQALKMVKAGRREAAAELMEAFAAGFMSQKETRRAARSPTERSGRLSTHSAAGVRVAMNARDRERAAAFAPMSTLEAYYRQTGRDFAPHAARLAETDARRLTAARYVPRNPGQIGDAIPLSARERADVSASLPSSLDVYRRMKARDFTDDGGNVIKDDKPKRQKSNGMPYRDDEDADDAAEHAKAMSRLQGKRF